MRWVVNILKIKGRIRMELYKAYRPKTLNEVMGNEATVKSVKQMLGRKAVPHAILFSGDSGCGKTTTARILKTELKCHDMDFREMNSASYRGIDSIREIQHTMNLAPSGGKVRIWLLDEAHKISGDGQAAMLKMLEDTPKHVYFFIATTNPEKLIKPLLDRCTKLVFKSLSESDLEKLLLRVGKAEGLNLSKSLIERLVSNAGGSARTLLVLLDKVGRLEAKDQQEAIEAGLREENQAIDLCRALISKRPWKEVAAILNNLTDDAESLRHPILGYARAVLLKSGDYQAYNVIRIFENNFFDGKNASLAAACWEAVSTK